MIQLLMNSVKQLNVTAYPVM
ncbi:unnamed protein product [Pieris macdunnoughi]|uniref:Uncharacterized protein n=1 Tax=Pieris macdunnoughi TaxID=345717 RepID=A0A821L1D8_9NEOP|nr:unnamed protein product [Pieris macdunnoughi]